VYDVAAASPVSLYEFVGAIPIKDPLRYTSYPVTPTLSVDAVHVRLIWLVEMAEAARFVGTLGGVVSVTPLFTVTLIGALMPTLPAASYACVVSVWVPFVRLTVFKENVYGADVSCAVSAPSTRSCTCVTPTLSEALAVTDAVPERVEPFVGLVMLVVGGVVSPLPVPVGFGNPVAVRG
jgi:hypothetical protein